MITRQIIKIDEEKCIGCGKCADACHEGAIEMVNGKAHLTKENFCDGFGDCLPSCPVDAIHFETRLAPEYDEEAVKKAKESNHNCSSSSCPGSKEQKIQVKLSNFEGDVPSELSMWPIQLKLSPVQSDVFENKELLIATDCTAFAYGNFHHDFLKGKTLLIACPKLDKEPYAEKLAQIFKYNYIKSVTLVIMEVPCCTKMLRFVEEAISISKQKLPLIVKVVTLNGEIKEWNY